MKTHTPSHQKTLIRIGSRTSALARVQVSEVEDKLRSAGISAPTEIRFFESGGDRNKSIPLDDPAVAPDFFTDTLDQALIDNDIDVAVHSAKDLPDNLNASLSILALTEAPDTTDAFVGRAPLEKLPAGSKIGTSSSLRREGLQRFYPDLTPVPIRGTIEERLRQVDDGVCDGIIVATVALKRLGLEERITQILPWDGFPLQGQLAVVGRGDRPDLVDFFRMIDVRRIYGDVILTGAGPGDPELITLKGIQALRRSDVVFYDYVVHPDILKHAPQANHVFVGKRKGRHSCPQSDLSRLLRDTAMAGKSVVRLKGGDPFIFGRGAEEMMYLRSYHIPVKSIPGVSSATSIPTSLGVPLTARQLSSSVAFVTGHGEKEEPSRRDLMRIPDAQTLVFLMGLTKLDIIVESLLAAGRPASTPAMAVSRGTRADEKVVHATLETLVDKVHESHLDQPALFVVGPTVRLYSSRERPVILYTGTHPQAYQAMGRVIHWPMIQVTPRDLSPEEASLLENSSEKYDWIILTSPHTVRIVADSLKKILRSNENQRARIAVIGPTTRHVLEREGLSADLIPMIETSQGLLDAFARVPVRGGERALFPRSELPNPTLKKGLSDMGVRVDEVAVYHNTKPPRRELPHENIDKIFFSSPSSVKNFLSDYGSIPGDWTIISRGPLTRKAVEDAGYPSEVLIYG